MEEDQVSSGGSEDEAKLERQILEQQKKLEAKRAKRRERVKLEEEKKRKREAEAEEEKVKRQASSQKEATESRFLERLQGLKHASKEVKEKKEELNKVREKSFTLGQPERECNSDEEMEGDHSEWDKFSGIRISRRYISPDLLAEQFENKELFDLRRLLSVVCPPKFEDPDCANFVVFGIVAQKSDIRHTKRGHKYVLFTLTDLNYEVLLSLHGEAFEKYWKTHDGTVVAILNPSIYKMSKNENEPPNSFGLSLTVGSDVMLEIGKAKHLGTCRAITAKGNRCRSWINKRKTSYCDYHTSNGVQKMSSARPELNSLPTKTFAPKGADGRPMKYMIGGSVKHKQGLQPDYQAKKASNVFVGGKSDLNSHPETDYMDKHASEKRFQQRMKNMEIERKIRDALSQTPGGTMLKSYRPDGKPAEEKPEKPKDSTGRRAFSIDQIRKIGYDPSNQQQNVPKDRKVDIPVNCNLRKKQSKAAPLPKQQGKQINDDSDDDDDDLEIV